MTTELYNPVILELATSIPFHGRLGIADATAERRSPICGSRVIVEVALDDAGRVAELGMEVRACALGRASASLMGAHAVGRSIDELISARDALAAFLAEERADAGEWPGLDVFEPARAYRARHPSIRLAFEAVVDAVTAALDRRRRGA